MVSDANQPLYIKGQYNIEGMAAAGGSGGAGGPSRGGPSRSSVPAATPDSTNAATAFFAQAVDAWNDHIDTTGGIDNFEAAGTLFDVMHTEVGRCKLDPLGIPKFVL